MSVDFLQPGEQIIMTGKANKTVAGGALGAKGGVLTLTDRRIVFCAHAINIGSKFDEIPLNMIAVTSNTLNLLCPTPNSIRVTLRDGTGHTFIVVGKDKENWKNAISRVTAMLMNNGNPDQTAAPVSQQPIYIQPPAAEQNTVSIDKRKNDMFAWIMATIPITGIILSAFLGFGIGTVSLILNIIFGYIDENNLKKQGIDTSAFGKWAFLVPYYLYKRAKALNDSMAYFIVWVVLFVLVWL